MMRKSNILLWPLMAILISCGSGGTKNNLVEPETGIKMVKIMTVDPGHFHAALVQKTMYEQVSPDVYVYSTEGPDLEQHLNRIRSYNSRANDPTKWNEIVYTGEDFFDKMLAERRGNVVVLSGNNRKKADYILKSVKAGFNVLADKPMVITPEEFPRLEEAFKTAAEKGVLLYDIMTERYEITTMLQKEFSQIPEVFGTLLPGSESDPSVTKVSVHHFSKIVSGSPLIRPAWFFDVEQQGEGIVDVTTHLTDLVQWECFPGKILSREDVVMGPANRWPTIITREEFKGVTGLEEFPEYLLKDTKDGKLNVYANGEMTYRLKGVWAKVSVEWKYRAPEGGGDTHFSVMKGSKCDLVIRQTADEKFIPTLYVENIKGTGIDELAFVLATSVKLLPYDSLTVEKLDSKTLRINIPKKYRVGHEEHFAQVTAKYLEYLKDGKLPEWEVPNMITKYYTTTMGLKKAKGL